MFYKPRANDPRPLLVGLHSWSEGYRQDESVIYAEWCIANGWVFIHPHFRGPNGSPQTTGSELVIGGVLSAVEYAKAHARVDEGRVYVVGWSGGGHLGLLLAGRAPEMWAGISAWVPISDLNAWYEQSRRLGTKYAREIAASCGGRPAGDSAVARECRKRLPFTYLERAGGMPLDINHDIRDGYGAVPCRSASRCEPLTCWQRPMTASLGRGGAFATCEDGIDTTGIVRHNRFDSEVTDPVIDEVVDVAEALPLMETQRCQRDVARITIEVRAIQPWSAIRFAMDVK